MLMRTLAICAALLLGCITQADAKVRRRHRTHEDKIFAADRDSVLRENQAADQMGALRYFTQVQIDADVLAGKLVPLQCYTICSISPKLPSNRRFALPATVNFVAQLSGEFYQAFHKPLVIDSMVRAATTQKQLVQYNRSAASAYGLRASTHERGTDVDISKKLNKVQHQWLVVKLLYYRAIGRVLVIEEKRCIHLFIER